MRRLVFGLALVLLCGTVAAEQIKPPKSTTRAAVSGAVKKPAVKKKPVPKGPAAKLLFSAVESPAPLAARAIGSYAKGCLSGGAALPINGPAWQVMRLSRNRNWGHPRLLDYLERLAKDASTLDGWPGLLVGDMSQPRGGPMITGHTSHQVGLDADIWLTPMPNRILTAEEREEITATSMLKDPFTVDPAVWTPQHLMLIRRAASYPQVARIFVHPAIKKTMCEQAGQDRSWLAKVRPWWGHFYHFHVRLSCPPGVPGCGNQAPVGGQDGCGKELNEWFAMLRKSEIAKARPVPPGAKPPRRKPPLTLADLPSDCRPVIAAAGGPPKAAAEGMAPAALRAAASKDAGPPAPSLDAEALAALKAELAGAKPAATQASAAGGMPLPDRKPSR